eukprot:4986728-Prorocentrum_lima.AAC.1
MSHALVWDWPRSHDRGRLVALAPDLPPMPLEVSTLGVLPHLPRLIVPGEPGSPHVNHVDHG